MYGIIRANKIKLSSQLNGLQRHNQRGANDYVPSNDLVHPDFTQYNQSLVENDNWKKAIQYVLHSYGIEKVRKDSVGLIDGILTTSHDFFKDKDIGEISQFFKEALPLIKKEFGPVISAQIHLDEQTPHMHFECVPIVENSNGTYSLSAKRVMGNKKDYVQRQDRFYEKFFKKYGLERGISKELTNAEHVASQRHRAEQLQKDIKQATSQLAEIKDKMEDVLRDKDVARFMLDQAIRDCDADAINKYTEELQEVENAQKAYTNFLDMLEI